MLTVKLPDNDEIIIGGFNNGLGHVHTQNHKIDKYAELLIVPAHEFHIVGGNQITGIVGIKSIELPKKENDFKFRVSLKNRSFPTIDIIPIQLGNTRYYDICLYNTNYK